MNLPLYSPKAPLITHISNKLHHIRFHDRIKTNFKGLDKLLMRWRFVIKEKAWRVCIAAHSYQASFKANPLNRLNILASRCGSAIKCGSVFEIIFCLLF